MRKDAPGLAISSGRLFLTLTDVVSWFLLASLDVIGAAVDVGCPLVYIG